ncbi:MBL fold metallo-hydrolase [Streptomyces sp. NPDC101213]|uniref:MBL fold metallo-hydrolase n=1 Tax=Streptomyces sp. NPDC101213 TaxID=3366130 RepID=UPI00380064D6
MRTLPSTHLGLTVLGTASPHPGPGRPCSGYLVRGGGAEVWVDAGPGTFAELRRHTDPRRLTAIRTSHLHAEHSADLLAAVHAFAFGGMTPPAPAPAPVPVPVYAPRDRPLRLAGLLGRPDVRFLDGILDFRPLHDGHTVRHGDLRPTSRAVLHDTEAYGPRAECRGSVPAYSGDSGPCDALTELARGADLFLCEADVDAHCEGEQRVHLTPEDAGAFAKGARELLVTHGGPTLTREAAADRVAPVLGGRTAAAREGDTVSL